MAAGWASVSSHVIIWSRMTLELRSESSVHWEINSLCRVEVERLTTRSALACVSRTLPVRALGV